MTRTVLLMLLCATSLSAQEQTASPTSPTPTTRIDVPATSTDIDSADDEIKDAISRVTGQPNGTHLQYVQSGKMPLNATDARTFERDGRAVSFVDVPKPVDIGWGGGQIVPPAASQKDGTIEYQIGHDADGKPLFVTLLLKGVLTGEKEPEELRDAIAKLADSRVRQCSGERSCTRWCETDQGVEYCCEYTCVGK